VGQIAAELGQPLMPWQQYVADVALELDPDTGRLWYRHVVLTVPRQSGKTTLILSVAIHRALGFGQAQRIVYAAQTRLDARKKLVYDQMPLVAKSPFASLHTPRLASGEEALLWHNGSIHGISSNTEKAGHGGTLDLSFVDEAFAQVDDRLDQAFSPAMITRPQPQSWVVSTAGTVDSTYLNDKVAAGREAATDPTSRMAFFEWSADPAADPADPATWRSCMPALGFTVTEAAVRAEFESLNLAEFKRAYLNIPTSRHLFEPVIDPDLWLSFADPSSSIVGTPAFSVDIKPDRSSGTIAVYGQRSDGVGHGEVVERFTSAQGIAEALAGLHQRHPSAPIGIDTGSASGSLIPDLERLGVPFVPISAGDYVRACGAFYDDVIAGNLRHLDDPDLNAALSVATKRELAGAWAWSKKEGDITPLVALTLAKFTFATRVLTGSSPVFAY
jgi:hypothetical protein